MNKMQNDQCRSCGAPLAFDVQTGKLQCEFCGSGFDPLEYELEDGEEEETWGVEEGMRSYVCPLTRRKNKMRAALPALPNIFILSKGEKTVKIL